MPTFRVLSNKGNPVRGTRVLVTFHGILGSHSDGYTDDSGYVTVNGRGTCDISVGGKVVARRVDLARIKEILL